MRFPLFIATRYLFAKKSHRAVNILSAISLAGVTLNASAMVVVLSVFNGFENLITSLYNKFDPEVKILPKQGKFFDKPLQDSILFALKQDPTVAFYSVCLEEQALLRYTNQQYIATIKGVDRNYFHVTSLQEAITAPEKYEKIFDSIPTGIAGMGLAYFLGLKKNDYFNSLQIFAPSAERYSSLNPAESFNQKNMIISDFFSVEQSFDAKYLITSLPFLEDLLNHKDGGSSIEVKLNGNNASLFVSDINSTFNNRVAVLDRNHQNEALFKVLKSEKLYGFLIVSFIFFLSVLNVAASTTMLISEKKDDLVLLKRLGCSDTLLHRIFLLEGMLINTIGLTLGLIFGVALCVIQQCFGIIKFEGAGTFVTDYYPVVIKASDLFLSVFTIAMAGFITLYFTVKAVFYAKNSRQSKRLSLP